MSGRSTKKKNSGNASHSQTWLPTASAKNRITQANTGTRHRRRPVRHLLAAHAPSAQAAGPGWYGGPGVEGEIGDQAVELGIGLGLEGSPVAVGELVGVEAARHVLSAEEVADGLPIMVRSSQAAVLGEYVE